MVGAPNPNTYSSVAVELGQRSAPKQSRQQAFQISLGVYLQVIKGLGLQVEDLVFRGLCLGLRGQGQLSWDLLSPFEDPSVPSAFSRKISEGQLTPGGMVRVGFGWV